MKRILSVFLALVLTFTVSACTFTENPEETEFSEQSELLALSDEELVAFLKNSDVEIPAALYENEMYCVPFVRTLIKEIETDSAKTALIRDPDLFLFALAVEKAVKEFYAESSD